MFDVFVGCRAGFAGHPSVGDIFRFDVVHVDQVDGAGAVQSFARAVDDVYGDIRAGEGYGVGDAVDVADHEGFGDGVQVRLEQGFHCDLSTYACWVAHADCQDRPPVHSVIPPRDGECVLLCSAGGCVAISVPCGEEGAEAGRTAGRAGRTGRAGRKPIAAVSANGWCETPVIQCGSFCYATDANRGVGPGEGGSWWLGGRPALRE